MGRLLTDGSTGALERRRIFVLCPDPIAALDLSECLERAGADAVAPLDLQQLWSYLQQGLPDAAVGEIRGDRQWPSVAIALLHELAVPQVLGGTERQRALLRPQMPNAAFLAAPIRAEDAVFSLSVMLTSNWGRMLRPTWSSRRPPRIAPRTFELTLVSKRAQARVTTA